MKLFISLIDYFLLTFLRFYDILPIDILKGYFIMAFSDYGYDEKFQDLPLMLYFRKDRTLDLSRSCINIVPAGLKGVDIIQLPTKPIAIAPDFKGRVKYKNCAFSFFTLTEEETKEAKRVYKKHKRFCETPHNWAGSSLHTNYLNMPKNMHFITVGQRTFLDLRRCNVQVKRENLYISVDAVLLPDDRKGKATRLLRRMKYIERQRG